VADTAWTPNGSSACRLPPAFAVVEDEEGDDPKSGPAERQGEDEQQPELVPANVPVHDGPGRIGGIDVDGNGLAALHCLPEGAVPALLPGADVVAPVHQAHPLPAILGAVEPVPVAGGDLVALAVVAGAALQLGRFHEGVGWEPVSGGEAVAAGGNDEEGQDGDADGGEQSAPDDTDDQLRPVAAAGWGSGQARS